MAINPDVKRAYEALSGKKVLYDKLFGYYDGNQPLLYTNSRLKEIFAGLDAVFVENWCAVIVDAVKDRVDLTGLSSQDTSAQTQLELLWEQSELGQESDDVHEAALVTGEGFIVAWPDDEGQPQAYANDPRLVHCFYDPENPRCMEFAAKWWKGKGDLVYMTLYYLDRLEYYGSKSRDVSNAAVFRPLEIEAEVNPFGRIPVFHFRNKRRVTLGELVNVVPIQNGINKLLTDMMVAAEFGAFKQRYIISSSDIVGKLRNAPNEIWDIPAGDNMGQQTQVGELTAAELTNYLSAIDNLAGALSSITRTPKHYFMRTGGDPSGEALIAMEAPLNKKVQDYIDRFEPTWRAVGAFLCELAGVSVAAQDITAHFSDPETVQPMTQAQITQTRVSTGVPLATALAWEGMDEADIEQLEKDRAAERAAQQSSLAQVLLSAERQFNAGQQQQVLPGQNQVSDA